MQSDRDEPPGPVARGPPDVRVRADKPVASLRARQARPGLRHRTQRADGLRIGHWRVHVADSVDAVLAAELRAGAVDVARASAGGAEIALVQIEDAVAPAVHTGIEARDHERGRACHAGNSALSTLDLVSEAAPARILLSWLSSRLAIHNAGDVTDLMTTAW